MDITISLNPDAIQVPTIERIPDKFPEITKKNQRQHPKMQPLVCKAFIYGISATFLFSS